ncbi:YjfB family protein [Paracidovorax anthurii]|uniref:Putative motility protein YjfB-like n=1 Tax=Paracidovorax anthurii TaxID=78229 RepID=A0A328ZB23_9BURK|nr:YjfB family protein [Paracidovorax anthurii]RAR82593.1 putative motility protein YjfB-like [Paracidovorax anthurii]WCM91037.1 YjfB family protein [Acidovorax sp. NCPPB 2350]
MDVSLSQSVVNTATALASQKTSDAVNITVLKKAIDIQKTSAAQLLEALPQPQLATSGSLGTQVNTFA